MSKSLDILPIGGNIMSLFGWTDKKIKKLNTFDVALIKIAVMGFTLMVAKIWEPILSLDWYWYAGIWIVAAAFPLYSFFKK